MSYFSKHLLESGACTTIITVIPKRIAVHLSSKFHDLLISQKLFRNQQRYESRFAALTHIFRQFQVGHIPGLGLLNGEDGGRVRAHMSRHQQFSLCWKKTVSTWRTGLSRKMRLLRRVSLNSAQIATITSDLILQSSFTRPSPRGEHFAVMVPPTKKLMMFEKGVWERIRSLY